MSGQVYQLFGSPGPVFESSKRGGVGVDGAASLDWGAAHRRVDLMQDALLVQRRGKVFWVCPNCQRTLGEVAGSRLIVAVKRSWHFTFRAEDRNAPAET